jgi:hypothetical protein
LPASTPTLQLNENDLKQQTHADGTLALGDVPVLDDLIQAKKNIAAGAEENVLDSLPLLMAPYGPVNDSSQTQIAGRSAGAATGKVGAQGGTEPLASSLAPQVAERSEFGLAPPPVVPSQISSVPQRGSEVVTASREAEGLTRGLAVPLAKGRERTQLAQLQDKNGILQKPPASKELSLQKKEKLSEIDTLKCLRYQTVPFQVPRSPPLWEMMVRKLSISLNECGMLTVCQAKSSNVTAAAPSRQVTVDGDIAQSEDGAAVHPTRAGAP